MRCQFNLSPHRFFLCVLLCGLQTDILGPSWTLCGQHRYVYSSVDIREDHDHVAMELLGTEWCLLSHRVWSRSSTPSRKSQTTFE